MTRKIVTDTIAEAAAGCGYCFHTGPDYRIPTAIVAYPALWLCPPKIVAIEGRREGCIKYRIELQLMRLADRHGRKTQPEIDPWEQLEADALQLHGLLLDNDHIRSLAMVQCAPAEFSLTHHGETSMSLQLEIEVGFCNL